MLVQSIDSSRPGSDGFIVDWVRSLASKIDQLFVLTYHYNPKEKLPKNVFVEVIKGKNSISRNLNLFWKSFWLAKDADVIFAHILEVFGITAGVIGKITGKKSSLWYCQGYDLSRHWGAKIALFLIDNVFTASYEIKERYSREVGGWVGQKTIVVGHGIYLPRYG